MTTPVPTLVRGGRFAVSLDGGATITEFSCAPNSVIITPAAGDTGTPVEVLCGDQLGAASGPTTWSLDLSSIQLMKTADTEAESLVLWALEHDVEQAEFWFQQSQNPESKIFTVTATVIALPLGGVVGGEIPLSEISWPMQAKPTIATAWPTPTP